MADRPVAKIRVRWSQLSFAFWDNQRKLPSITLTKSWRDEGGQWHNQNIGVTRRDLVELSHQLPKVIAFFDKTAAEMRATGPLPGEGQESVAPEKETTEPKKEEGTYEFVE
jgi:hypothetical protein